MPVTPTESGLFIAKVPFLTAKVLLNVVDSKRNLYEDLAPAIVSIWVAKMKS
jgi:hypothetical protein